MKQSPLEDTEITEEEHRLLQELAKIVAQAILLQEKEKQGVGKDDLLLFDLKWVITLPQ